MSSPAAAIVVIAQTIKEIIGFVKDLTDPTKREKAYRLKLEKKAYESLKTSDNMVSVFEKILLRYQVLLEIIKDGGGLDSFDKNLDDDLEEMKKLVEKAEKYIKQYKDDR